MFDIPGHTLKVTVKKKVGKDMPSKATFNEYFKAESDPENYGLGDEHTKPLRYIWQKRWFSGRRRRPRQAAAT